jgi:glycine cleavage system protein P-like pyridoxal-binding family
MYIAMMGAEGLRPPSAILAANYIARRLAPHFPVLYAGRTDSSRECILDLRPLKIERCIGRRCLEAADGLPRDDELPGRGHPDGRATESERRRS